MNTYSIYSFSRAPFPFRFFLFIHSIHNEIEKETISLSYAFQYEANATIWKVFELVRKMSSDWTRAVDERSYKKLCICDSWKLKVINLKFSNELTDIRKFWTEFLSNEVFFDAFQAQTMHSLEKRKFCSKMVFTKKVSLSVIPKSLSKFQTHSSVISEFLPIETISGKSQLFNCMFLC